MLNLVSTQSWQIGYVFRNFESESKLYTTYSISIQTSGFASRIIHSGQQKLLFKFGQFWLGRHMFIASLRHLRGTYLRRQRKSRNAYKLT